MRRAQQGLTLIGFIMVLIVLGCVAYLAMRLIPMYIEYFGIVKALESTVKDPGITTADEYTLRDKISRHFETGYVHSIQPKDIKITHAQDGLKLAVDYEVREPLVYNIFLVGHFEKTVSTSPGKAGDQ